MEVYRPRRFFAFSMAGAAALWLAVLVYLASLGDVPARTMLSAAFFMAFFVVSMTYYARTAIVLDRSGVTYRGLVRTLRFPYSDIRTVDILPGPVTVYAIRSAGHPGVHFTSFFARHRQLMEQIVSRAGLSPLSGS